LRATIEFTDTKAMPNTASPTESRYAVYFRAGYRFGFRIRNSNCGVKLTAERIEWTFDGRDDGAPFTNIRSVHLQTGGDPKSPLNTCMITFTDGFQLYVTNGDSWGELGGEEQVHAFRGFALDLHARLAAKGHARFTAGYQGFRYPLLIACGVALGLLCVVGPIVAMVASRSLWPITMLIGGAGLYFPLIKSIEKNAPRSYDPRHPPEELLE
jgi:hypothetical protein